MAAGFAAFVADGSVEIADQTAENAAANNGLMFVIPLIKYGIATYSAYELYQTLQFAYESAEILLDNTGKYSEEEKIARVEEIAISLAIDIATIPVGIGALKMLEGVIEKAKDNERLYEIVAELEQIVVKGDSYTPSPGCTAGVCGSAVDSIYTNTKPLNDEFPELVGVNPHYVENAGPGVNINCVSCSNAAFDRLTGRDPSAVSDPPLKYGDPMSFFSRVLGFSSFTTRDDVIQRFIEQGDGTVGILDITTRRPAPNQRDAHAIVGVNRGGEVIFIDPQSQTIVDLAPNIEVRVGFGI